jgi:hypothetical protein
VELQHAIGGVRADLTEQERIYTEVRARKVGAQHRLTSVDGQLKTLDEELQKVGATRDITSLLSLESSTRQQRDDLSTLKTRSLQTRDLLSQIEKNRARISASDQLRAAEVNLEQLQRHQEKQSSRATQFAALQKALEKAQSTTAEQVLNNVRLPVGMMFRAIDCWLSMGY